MRANNMQAIIDLAVKSADGARQKSRKWTPGEDAYLKANLGYKTEAEIGKALGRTAVAVLLRWKRDLQLPSPSKAPGILTARDAARMLGIDEHKVSHWVAKGFIPGRLMAGKRLIRLIDHDAFINWALDPDHWMYFDVRKVKDEELKKLLKAARKSWGDEWWPTVRVAHYHGVATSDVKRYIQRGVIKATQIRYSYGGRHPQLRWKLWFVRKSEATRKSLKFVRRKDAN